MGPCFTILINKFLGSNVKNLISLIRTPYTNSNFKLTIRNRHIVVCVDNDWDEIIKPAYTGQKIFSLPM